MKFSLITPTHNDKYLYDLFQTIIEQSYSNWEWIILLNGSMRSKSIVMSDPRVKVYETNTSQNIGALKSEAFSHATGDILVEVDHDDWLHKDCLLELYKIYSQNSDIGFVYSDDATVEVDDTFTPYSSNYGWTYHHEVFQDKRVIVMESFDPDPITFSDINFMPDHVRSWRSSVYKAIGGHKKLPILDDQDLLSRTYLSTKCHHIKKVLYYYRFYPENSYKSRLSEINTRKIQMKLQYMDSLATRFAELNNLMKVDLGGGIYKRPGFTSVDLHNGDIVSDLNDDFPLNDNSVGFMQASHILEHLRDPLHSMKEIFRVLAPGGIVKIEVPSTDGRGAFQDPTHVSYWNENSFLYYWNKEQHPFLKQYGYDYLKFQNIHCENEDWKNKVIVTRIYLRKVAGLSRYPGYREI